LPRAPAGDLIGNVKRRAGIAAVLLPNQGEVVVPKTVIESELAGYLPGVLDVHGGGMVAEPHVGRRAIGICVYHAQQVAGVRESGVLVGASAVLPGIRGLVKREGKSAMGAVIGDGWKSFPLRFPAELDRVVAAHPRQAGVGSGLDVFAVLVRIEVA